MRETSITNIEFVALLSFLLGFYIAFIFRNVSIPKPPLAEKQLNSSMPNMLITINCLAGLTYLIVISSAFLFSAGLFLTYDILSTTFAETGMYILERIIQNTIQLATGINASLTNSSLSLDQLAHIHAYITPYLRSYDALFRIIMDCVNFFDSSNSVHFDVLEDMQGRYRVAGNNLLELYRHIETLINISIEDSPIPAED